MRCIELHADGSYMMVPNAEAGDRLNFNGTWRVADGRITWRDSSQGFAPDVNAMDGAVNLDGLDPLSAARAWRGRRGDDVQAWLG